MDAASAFSARRSAATAAVRACANAASASFARRLASDAAFRAVVSSVSAKWKARVSSHPVGRQKQPPQPPTVLGLRVAHLCHGVFGRNPREQRRVAFGFGAGFRRKGSLQPHCHVVKLRAEFGAGVLCLCQVLGHCIFCTLVSCLGGLARLQVRGDGLQLQVQFFALFGLCVTTKTSLSEANAAQRCNPLRYASSVHTPLPGPGFERLS